MDRNFVRASIIDEKISPFGRSSNDDIQFFFGKPTFGPPCIRKDVKLGIETPL